MQATQQQVTPFLPTRYIGCLALHLEMRIPLDMLVQHVTHSVVTQCLSADPSGDGKDRRRNEAESMRPGYLHRAGHNN